MQIKINLKRNASIWINSQNIVATYFDNDRYQTTVYLSNGHKWTFQDESHQYTAEQINNYIWGKSTDEIRVPLSLV
jgi:hypothetical protein